MDKSRVGLNKASLDDLTRKGRRSRQRIIDTAITMIRDRGYSATTIQDICAGVGLGIGTFYHYFRSKEEVLLAYIKAEDQDLLDFYAQFDKTSYAQAILSVADHYVDMYLFKGVDLISHVYSMMLFSTIGLGNLSENAFHQILQNAFIQGQSNGEFSKEISVDTFCNLALSQWFFFTSLWCNNPDTYKIRDMVSEHFTQLLKLVATSSTSET